MTFRTLPRSSGKSAAAQRMREAGEAYERAHKEVAVKAPTKKPESKAPPVAAQRTAPAPETKPSIPATRAVAAVAIAGMSRFQPAPGGPPPQIAMIAPLTLRIEDAYQRDLSPKSMRLIRRIVEKWSWAKFKPPIVAKTREGLFIIDGQHTAIAATTLGINEIPVLIVGVEEIAHRAEAFVAHNRDRLIMSPFQVFHAEVAAGNKDAVGVAEAVAVAGAIIPRSAISRQNAKVGQIVSLGEVRNIYHTHGRDFLVRLLSIAVMAKAAPIQRTLARGVRLILSDKLFAEAAAQSDEKIAAGISSFKNIDFEAQRLANAKESLSRDQACAILICRAIGLTAGTQMGSTRARSKDETEERLRQVEEALADASWVPSEWGLTKSEVAVLNVLVLRRVATKEAIHTILYGDESDGGPDPKIIDVFVCKMRPKLEPARIKIETVWGDGYELTAESRAIINSMRSGIAA